jgi:Cu/Zn superoxide dismutase
MSWGYYSGEVTDYTTTPDIFEDARASAVMIGMDGRSFFRLRVTGIDATDGVYGVHLHQGKCVAGDSGGLAEGHYNVTWNSELKKIMGDVNKTTEVWLDLDVDSDGEARSTATVSFIPEGDRSIVLHALPTLRASDGTNGPGYAGTRLACLPFKIKVYGN